MKNEKTISGHAATAKAIRTDLKAAFPNVKFTVHSESFSGGDAVRISYTDGPLTDEVRVLVGKYQYGKFDSQEDYYEITNSRKDIPQVKYVQVQRDMSTEIRDRIYVNVKNQWAGAENLGYEDYVISAGQWMSVLVRRVFSETKML